FLFKHKNPSMVISCWGDSLTSGTTNSFSMPYLKALQANALRNQDPKMVTSNGIDEMTSAQIASKFGVKPIIGSIISISGEVAIESTRYSNRSD
ncbi:hypothetical protein, partial [Pseudomonas agarici]|uniref:hypothetical protein n=1 Tax=Pseudomonas agarici TaxID=46677 RepID=UPI001B7F933C